MRALSFVTSLLIALTLAVAQKGREARNAADIDGAPYEDHEEGMPDDNINDNEEPIRFEVWFVNEFPDKSIDVFWESWEEGDVDGAEPTQTRHFQGTIPPRGGAFSKEIKMGHEFSYDLDGERHFFAPGEPNEYGEQQAILAGDAEGFLDAT